MAYAGSASPYEYNPRGDRFNGAVGTTQPASVANRSAQPSQAAPGRGSSGNPYMDAVSGAANPAAMRAGVSPVSAQQPAPRPQWNQTVERMLGGQPPGVSLPSGPIYGATGPANPFGGGAGVQPPPVYTPAPQLPPGPGTNYGNDAVTVPIEWGPQDPNYDPSNFQHVAQYYQRFNPAVQANDVQNYREWAYDPLATGDERARRQAVHFNDWWSQGKPVKGVAPAGAGPGSPGGIFGGGGGGFDNWNPDTRVGGAYGPPGGSSSSSTSTSTTTPGTGTAPGDSNDYLRRLEASIRENFKTTRQENLDQFRHQGGVNGLSRYGGSPEMLGEMYQAMARDENSALLNPMLGVAENEQNRVLQKYGIDVGASTQRDVAATHAAAQQAAAGAALQGQMANIGWQRDRFAQEFPWQQEMFRTESDQDLLNSYLNYNTNVMQQLPVWMQVMGGNSADEFLRMWGLPTGGMY